MASTEKRNGVYYAKICIKGFPTPAATLTTLREARKWSQITEATMRESHYFPSTNHTLSEAIDRYRDSVLPGKRPRTQTDQGMQLAWWNSRLGA